jgi:hypothetical protein
VTGSRDFDTTAEPNLPGNPLFENPFPDAADPKHSVLAPYFVMMEKFRTLAEEYPNVSALWQAEFGHWQVWPLPRHDAKVLSERLGGSEEVPFSPGADLHLEYGAVYAERLIIEAGIKQDELNKILTRDRWLATAQFKASDVWLHAIREFWLSAREEAEASGVDLDVFEKVAEASGYLPGISTAIGRRVWSLMVTQHKSLKQIVKERQLSTGDEIDGTEEPDGWIQSGKIAYVFAASVYFCGVLAARRARDLEHSMTTAPADLSANVLYLNPPPFRYQYPDDFPAAGQMAIEHARLEANGHLEKRAIGDFADYIDALTEWSWAIITAATREIGRAGTKHEWSANRRRDELFNFAREVVLAAGTVGRGRHSFGDFIKSDKWRELDNLLLTSTEAPTLIIGRRGGRGRAEGGNAVGGKKLPRRNHKYEAIDKALHDISEARPKNHQEVFWFLTDRKVVIANREPFKSAGGWSKGFEQSPHSASAWLSQAWTRLGLPAFARGPKK